MHVIPDLCDKLQPVKDALRLRLLPPITRCSNISDTESLLFALPIREGGLGIPMVAEQAVEHHDGSPHPSSLYARGRALNHPYQLKPCTGF